MSDGFASLSLSAHLLEVVNELGYVTPTPIQEESIPVLLAGNDLIGQSKTGSGKTAAFALPILHQLEIDNRSLQALIICPTRELSAQVAREIRILGRKHPGLRVLELCGGQPVKPQVDALERGVHIVVGTPGRLLDHVSRDTIHTDKIRTVVLDEADRMLDMGFGADVETLLRAVPKSRQTVLFSATFPPGIEAISKRYQRNASRVTIADVESEGEGISQLKLQAEGDDKIHALFAVMQKHPHNSAIVFCNYKKTVVELLRELNRAGVSADRLDGDLDQYHRDQVLARFRNHSVKVLIATDVAGRGLDVEELDLVINYEFPQQPETYLHRIGRTGRAGRQGLAISFVSKRDNSRLESIEKLTGVPIETLPWSQDDSPDFDKLAKAIACEAPMVKILISGGRKDKVRAGDILGALTGDAGQLKGADIGKIEIRDRLSYVAVARSKGKGAAASLNAGRIKGKRFRASLIH